MTGKSRHGNDAQIPQFSDLRTMSLKGVRIGGDRMSKMQITRTGDEHYRVEVKDSFIDEDVNGSQVL